VFSLVIVGYEEMVMKNFLLLIQLALFCCLTALAQPGNITKDTAVSQQLPSNRTKGFAFLNFSAFVKDVNKVSLQWDVDSAEEGDYFIIERSTDGGQYETVGALRKDGNNNHYELNDMAPPNGTDQYRIKYSSQAGPVTYSKVIALNLSGDVDFKWYPNPVDKLFIIRTEHAVDIQVIDAIGFIRLSKRLQPGIQVINVSALERGVYILRVADKESNRIISNQLLKN
jgi:Secretion system C-terminal sorting domain